MTPRCSSGSRAREKPPFLPTRAAGLIGDDEHCWSDHGIFNIEGGCYAKCLGLSEEQEPQIYRAIRFGAVLENVVHDPLSRVPDYSDRSLTENTRACYPIEHIETALVPCVGGHPQNIIFLTCDAFGVLPPVSRLTPSQARYHFLSGYTAKVAGTEVGIAEPQATFSACFGAAFLVLHPTRYGAFLADKIRQHTSTSLARQHGLDRRSLRRRLTDQAGVHPSHHRRDPRRLAAPGAGRARQRTGNFKSHRRAQASPASCCNPRNTWANADAYDQAAAKLAALFRENFAKYSDAAPDGLRESGARV